MTDRILILDFGSQVTQLIARRVRENGVYMHRRHVNRCSISAAHDESDIDRTVELVGAFLAQHRQELTA